MRLTPPLPVSPLAAPFHFCLCRTPTLHTHSQEFSFFLPFLASVFIFMVKPTKDGMIEYGTWPGLYVPFPF